MAQHDKEYRYDDHEKLYKTKYHPGAKAVQGDVLGIKIGTDVGWINSSNSGEGYTNFTDKVGKKNI